SSRKRGVRGTRSTRAICASSVRCDVSNSRYVPSGLHATVPPHIVHKYDAGRGAPPLSETTYGFWNRPGPPDRYAIHWPSGDHVMECSGRNGGRSTSPAPSIRSWRVATSTTRSSFAPRSKAIVLPSGDHVGITSLRGPSVSLVSARVTKS